MGRLTVPALLPTATGALGATALLVSAPGARRATGEVLIAAVPCPWASRSRSRIRASRRPPGSVPVSSRRGCGPNRPR